MLSRGSEHDVVDVQEKVDVVGAAGEHGERRVGTRCLEADAQKVRRERAEPSTRRLLQAIKRLDEATYMVGSGQVDEARRLLAVDSLRETTVEEGVVDVELVHGPVARNSKREHSPNCSQFDNRTKSLAVVDTGLLGEPANNPTRLVTVEGAAGLEFLPVHPFTGHNIGTVWTRDKFPRVVCL